jgi:NADP-dependent 3-hydroxy acid dehydrogenase YdfG
MAVYAASKSAVRAITEGLRQEAGADLRVTLITPGMTSTEGAGAVTNPEVRANLQKSIDSMAMPPSAIARAIAFAIEQPDGIDVGEIVVRPTAQG